MRTMSKFAIAVGVLGFVGVASLAASNTLAMKNLERREAEARQLAEQLAEERPDTARLEELSEAVRAIDSRLERLAARMSDTPERSASAEGEWIEAREEFVALTGDVNEIRTWLEELEAEREAGEEASKATLIDEIFRRSPAERIRPEEIDAQRGIAGDGAASDDTRLAALRQLRSAKGIDRDVALSMIDLMDATSESRVRADVIRNLHRSRHDELKQPLIDYLLHDPDREVREEAAETLGDYMSDQSVVAALERARDHDSSDDVREQARETLDGKD